MLPPPGPHNTDEREAPPLGRKSDEMNLENGEDSKKKAKRAGSVRKKRNKSN